MLESARRFGGGRSRRLKVALSLYFALLAFSALAIVLIRTDRASPASAVIFVSLAYCVVVLGWTVGAFGRLRDGLSQTGGLIWYPVAVALGCLTFGLAVVLTRFAVSALDVTEISYSGPLLQAGHGWWVIFLLVCVQPAVVEELAFRGVILGALRGVLGLRDAVIVSALMFMVLHLAVLSFPHLLVIGLVVGYLRVRSGSLYPCMVMHFTHNLAVLLAEAAGM